MPWIRLQTGNSAAGVYGTLLTLSVLVGLSADKARPGVMVATLAVSAAVFWIAHAHANLVARWVSSETRPQRRAVLDAMAREAPMLEAAAPALGLLLLAWIGVVSTAFAVWTSLIVGVASLVAWGVLIARSARLGPMGIVIVAGVNLALGGLIVLLKLLVH